MARNPNFLTPRPGQRPTRYGSGEASPEQRGLVLIPVVMHGLKGEPIDTVELTEQQAVIFAASLLEAAVTARHRATERASEEEAAWEPG